VAEIKDRLAKCEPKAALAREYGVSRQTFNVVAGAQGGQEPRVANAPLSQPGYIPCDRRPAGPARGDPCKDGALRVTSLDEVASHGQDFAVLLKSDHAVPDRFLLNRTEQGFVDYRKGPEMEFMVKLVKGQGPV